MARKWIFSSFLIIGVCLYILIYSIQISRAGILRAYQGGTINMELIRSNEIANLTAIEWAHAVNSQQELINALNSSIAMIEADIVMGTLINDTSGMKMPVMGHPPEDKSDISLEQFLRQILEHNQKNTSNTKGVKLDFKSTQVFKDSLDTLDELWPMMNYPIWLNADILKGPVGEPSVNPVDPTDFFRGCKQFKSAVLSIGWTTRWGSNFTDGRYLDNHVNEMLEVIGKNSIKDSGHKITFPVRAGIVAQSLPQIQNLYKELSPTNEVTLTIWSSKGDNVDIEKLRNLILSFGIDKVYLDVPEEVSSRLDLGKSTISAATGSLFNFSILSLCMLVTSVIVHQYIILD